MSESQKQTERRDAAMSDHFDPIDPYAEPRTIDEARQQMVADLHRAVYGDSWARPQSAAQVWAELLERVSMARRQFHR